MLTLNVPLSLLNINVEHFFSYQIPADTYISSATPSVVTYNLINPPSWCTYDIETRTISGTPSISHIGMEKTLLQVYDVEDIAITTLDTNIYAFVNQTDKLKFSNVKIALVNSNSAVITWRKDAQYEDVTSTLVFVSEDMNAPEYYVYNGNTYIGVDDFTSTESSLLEANPDCSSMTPLTGSYSTYKCIYNGTGKTCYTYNLEPQKSYKVMMFSGVNSIYYGCDAASFTLTTQPEEETNQMQFNIFDAVSKLPVKDARVTLKNRYNYVVQTYTTDELGIFHTYELGEGVYSIIVEHDSYQLYEKVGVYNRIRVTEYDRDTKSINDNETKNRVVLYNAGKPFIDRTGSFNIYLNR